MPKCVVFSERAFISILVETQEKIQTETGGVFLGYRKGDIWYVIESIDPGPNSVFQTAYFEYDQAYINHLINKVSRLYSTQLDLIGRYGKVEERNLVGVRLNNSLWGKGAWRFQKDE